MGEDEVGESVMASIAATCILVCHCGRRLARGWRRKGGASLKNENRRQDGSESASMDAKSNGQWAVGELPRYSRPRYRWF
ncbi:hypothetical protein GBZ26_15735 [Azospirillum formosense]|uniref:Secreted protein n=1 Tax=Azospirillum formosense TaxID=861533 RepID=A0ABX2KVP7_9PROT|nr:hypothetical protein [Azospirillum formosense]